MPVHRSLPAPAPSGPDAPRRTEPGREHAAPAADLTAALDASASLGAWALDWPAERLSLAGPLAEAFGLAPGERGAAPLVRFLARIHDEDRLRIGGLLDAVRDDGGTFEAEFRLPCPAPVPGRQDAPPEGGQVRWLRLTGRAEREAGGGVRIRGLAFDLTEMRLGRGSPALRAQWQVNQLAGHVIAMRGIVADLDSPPLARLLDRVAVEVALALARQLEPDAPRGVRH